MFITPVSKKLTDKYGFPYQMGLNECEVTSGLADEFSDEGLQFYTEQNFINAYTEYSGLIAVLRIPEDTKVYHFNHVSKAARIYIEQIIPLAEWDKWSDVDFCLDVCKRHGLALKFVKNQTPEICQAAVESFPLVLKYVREQTPELCLTACKKFGTSLQFVKNQTEEICLAAVRQNAYALCYVKEQDTNICLEAVRQNGLTLQFVQNQTEEICLAAVSQDWESYKYVKNKSPDICKVFVENSKKYPVSNYKVRVCKCPARVKKPRLNIAKQ